MRVWLCMFVLCASLWNLVKILSKKCKTFYCRKNTEWAHTYTHTQIYKYTNIQKGMNETVLPVFWWYHHHGVFSAYILGCRWWCSELHWSIQDCYTSSLHYWPSASDIQWHHTSNERNWGITEITMYYDDIEVKWPYQFYWVKFPFTPIIYFALTLYCFY